MKNILFILSLVIWCGCSNEIPFDTAGVGNTVDTRFSSSDSIYYFGSSDSKGYKLYEGTITGDDIYTYSFVRYW
ncbi:MULTISPECIES: hypothetical protein [Bacteroides]|jgi:hypothetical protein|uniref:hypothetical protein n=1 Tax=Bacteroides TaxID=816 RepID=UPI000E53B872|nr:MULTISPECIES: hypothetical protein [Bacteroides]RHL11340.1 hypothetical protein DW036_04145 [Bacteroides sp. AF39-11AC]